MKKIVYVALFLLTFGAHAKFKVDRSVGDSLKEVVDIACVQAARGLKSVRQHSGSDTSHPVIQESDAGPDSWVEWFQQAP